MPDAKCPYCGSAQLGVTISSTLHGASRKRRVGFCASCLGCRAQGPTTEQEADAIPAFTNPAAATAAHEKVVAEKDALLGSAGLLLRRTLNENTFNRLDAMEFVARIDAALSSVTFGGGK